jgi:DNA-binding LytR/AlgR family response regulator
LNYQGGYGMAAKKIVIAEDEQIVAFEIENRVKNMGYKVAGVFDNGQEVLDFFEKNTADLVIMDIKLKGDMTGIETAEKLLETNDIPIIYLTAYSDDITIDKAKKTMAYNYLVKPINERQLQINLEMALAKHDLEMKRTSKKEALLMGKSYSIKKIPFKRGDETILVDPKAIIYIEIENGIITFYKKDEIFTQRGTLKEWEEKLVDYDFYRSNKNYLINLNEVEKIVQNEEMTHSVKMKNCEEILSVARNKISYLKELLEI